jgi:tetratricopeptide (TPR) repeat protein
VLRAAIDDAHRGTGVLIELIGERGAGKSRLLAEAAGLARGMTTLRVACEVYTRDTPYTAWRELLHQLLGIGPDESAPVVLERVRAEIELCDPSLEPWMSLIGIVLDVEVPLSVEVTQLSSSARGTKLHEVVLRFLRRALVVPTIVLVEQAHLMDGASVELFQALASELESTAWVVLAARGEDAGGLVAADRPHRRIQLGPLGLEDTRALALATPEAARVPPHVVELAVERSGGSPQFLLDLLAAAAAGHREELPASVEAATMARIDALSPADAAVVRRAAVLGQAFDPRRLDDVLAPDLSPPDDGFWERMSEVFAREADGQVRFRRPALQEVAYSSLPFKLRRRLHEAVALRLERDAGGEQVADRERVADPAILSRHFELAGDYGRAHRYAMAAAALAAERSSHVDAVRLYRRAIDAGRALRPAADGRALADAWEQMGESLRAIGEPAAAARSFTEARRLVRDDPVAQARLFHRHAAVAERSEALTQAVRWLTRGLHCLAELEDAEAVAWRARLRSRLASVRNRQGRWAEAIAGCRQAITEAESVGELRALAHACSTLDLALVSSGRPAGATYSGRALEIFQQLGDAENEALALNNLGVFAYWDGRWDDAVALYRRSGESCRRAGRPADAAYTDCNVGEILSDQGKLDEAEARLLDARRVWSVTGEPQGVAFVDLLLARVAMRRGDCGKALPALEAAGSDLRRFGMDGYADFAAALVAEAQAFAGDPSRALEIVRSELRTADQHRPLVERVVGTALARLGQRDEAERELRRAFESARACRAPYDLAATIEMLAMLGAAEPELLAERDRILERLKIERLPVPAPPARIAADV